MGGPWRHELVREEHSCQTQGLYREGEPSCGEATSAGYGLDASKSETRTKEPFCGGLGRRSPLRGKLSPPGPLSPGKSCGDEPFPPAEELWLRSGSQAPPRCFSCSDEREPWVRTWAPLFPACSSSVYRPPGRAQGAAMWADPNIRGALGCCPCEESEGHLSP